jgi:2'-5' RNA ligase
MLRQFYIKTIKKEALYFLAIIPPSPQYEEALGFKNYFKENYQSKASLNSPPHITLHMPFQWKQEKEEELLQTFEEFRPSVKPFSLKLSGFGSFPPRVIFIDVEKNEELSRLHKELHQHCKKELNVFNANYKDKGFLPHLTLAFRDLKKPLYTKAWEEFEKKEYSNQFSVDKFVLLKHNGKVWEVYKEFPLAP